MRQDINEPSPVRLTGHRARIRRYRSHHRRIDYVPSLEVGIIIIHPLKMGTDRCLAGVCIRTQGGGAR